MMSSHERFAAVCNHQEPDRLPIDYLASLGIHHKVMQYYGLQTERELLERLGCDLYYLPARDISQNEGFLKIYRGPRLPSNDSERTCPFGIRYARTVGDWKFGADEALEGPLEKAESSQEVLDFDWPDPSWFDPEPLLAACEEYRDKVRVGGFWSAVFGNAYRMFGFGNFLMNLAMKPELIKVLINRITDFYLELNERLFSALKGQFDIYFIGNDFGSQNGLLFSEEMWLEFFYPSYRKLISLARGYGLKVMVHSCGSIVPLLGHFIELGVDIIDPVQTTADGMDPRSLKKDFGEQLVFHGAIDTQGVLPSGTPEQVYRHAVDTLNVFGREGGYIFAPCNNLQADTPVENIDAVYRAAQEFRPSVGGEKA
jgi:uroporphyrinogen decarboxylase